MKIISDMSNEDYHADKAYGKSDIDLFASDPYAVDWAKILQSAGSPSLNFGTAVHAMLLEPEFFEKNYVVAPKIDRRPNTGKKAWADFLEQSKGKLVMDAEEGIKLSRIKESVMAHKQCKDLIECEGLAEHSIFWTDEETGLRLRCRPDKMISERQILVDVKTTADLSKFHYSVEDYRYHVQDAFYCDGVNIVTGGNYEMYFLVVQTTQSCGRYPVRLLTLPDYATEYGRSTYRKDLNGLAEFLESGYSPVQELQMSRRFDDAADEDAGEVII